MSAHGEGLLLSRNPMPPSTCIANDVMTSVATSTLSDVFELCLCVYSGYNAVLGLKSSSHVLIQAMYAEDRTEGNEAVSGSSDRTYK